MQRRVWVATAITDRWPATVLSRPIPADGTDWRVRFPAGRIFDGAELTTQVRANVAKPGRVAIVRPEPRRLAQFTQPRQRGLLVAADGAVDGGAYYALDVRESARQAVETPDNPTIAIPRREQRGEEASTWLLCRHKVAYLQHTSSIGTLVARGFCLPGHLVDESPRHERVLLLLSAALMGSFGIRACVTPDCDYGDVEGFVLGGHVIVANWIRTPGLWHVDTRGPGAALTTGTVTRSH